jgi:hypothetical protein
VSRLGLFLLGVGMVSLGLAYIVPQTSRLCWPLSYAAIGCGVAGGLILINSTGGVR